MPYRVTHERLLAQRRYLLTLCAQLGPDNPVHVRCNAAESLIATGPHPCLVEDLVSEDVIISQQAKLELEALNRRRATGEQVELSVRYMPFVEAMTDERFCWWSLRGWQAARATRKVLLALLDVCSKLSPADREPEELACLATFFAKLFQNLPQPWRRLYGSRLCRAGYDVWTEYWHRQSAQDFVTATVTLGSLLNSRIPFVRIGAFAALNQCFETLFPRTDFAEAEVSLREAFDLLGYTYGFPLERRCDREGAEMIRFCRKTLHALEELPEELRLKFAEDKLLFLRQIDAAHDCIAGRETKQAFRLAYTWLQLQRLSS